MKPITSSVYYVGVNDRTKQLFENLWPLPYGVSYNSYLIVDEKITLVDTVDTCYSERFIRQIQAIIGDKPIDYLVINHMEPDHSGSINTIRSLYPGIQLVGNSKTHGMLEGFYGIKEGLVEVKEGSTLNIGAKTLQFFMVPMVHWPETMVTFDASEGVLFSGDAFGSFGTLDGAVLDSDLNLDRYWNEMTRYYSNIVGKYGSPVQKALQKIAGLEVKTICSTHGPVWQSQIERVISEYDRMSRYEGKPGVVVVYGSMYGNTEEMAEAVCEGVVAGGVKDVVLHNVMKTHASQIIADVFTYKGLIIGSPTYTNELFPDVESLTKKLEYRDIKNRLFASFGSFTWAGAAVKRLNAFAEQMKWEVVTASVEEKQALKPENREACFELGRAMAKRILE